MKLDDFGVGASVKDLPDTLTTEAELIRDELPIPTTKEIERLHLFEPFHVKTYASHSPIVIHITQNVKVL